MIKIEESSVFASTNNYVCEDVNITDLDSKKHFVLSMHTGFNQFDFVPMSEFDTKKKTDQFVTLVFENTIGRRYKLVVDSYQKICTKVRGYVNANRVNASDVMVDYENRTCKLISKVFADGEENVFNIKAGYNLNYICNGILVRSN